MFRISADVIDSADLVAALSNQQAGALVVFEGWVRNHNSGKIVTSLEYQIYENLALKEGNKIIEEVIQKFNLHQALCVHRQGHLKLGDVAVWVGATASHRDNAFKATRYIIDEVKHRLPIWKKEHYQNEMAEWVFCKHHQTNEYDEATYYQKQSGIVDQDKLRHSKVLVVGAGGLGCNVLMSLTSAGVGHLTILDFDKISLSNIHRQPLYSPNVVGEYKVHVAEEKLRQLNPYVQIQTIRERLNSSHIDGYDLVLDCTDNMQTKFFIHDLCFKTRIPFISASVYKGEGQIRTFLPEKSSGCWRCYKNQAPDDSLLGNCNDFGVLGATTAVIGSWQAAQALEFLQHRTNKTLSHTLYINLNDLDMMKIKNAIDPECETCQGKVQLLTCDFEVSKQDLNDEFEVLDIRNLSDQEIISYQTSAKYLVLSCHRGFRSKNIAMQLRDKGHRHYYSLQGGACSL